MRAGEFVTYTLTEGDVEDIVDQRAFMAKAQVTLQSADDRHSSIRQDTTPRRVFVGNPVEVGDEFPLLVTKVRDNGDYSGQVFLDGNDTLWVIVLANEPVDASAALSSGKSQPAPVAV